MSNAAMVMGGEAGVTPTELGWKFTRWGLGLFILGFFTGFVPILHYMLGAQAGDVGPVFLKNITLWWEDSCAKIESVRSYVAYGRTN